MPSRFASIAVRFAVPSVVAAATLLACKPRIADNAVKGIDEDKNQLQERVGAPVESAEMLRPGPGFGSLAGDQRFLHKVRLHTLAKSARWDDLALLAKTPAGDFVLQEYELTMTVAGRELHWEMPALASFAAPLAARNLLVQLADSFFVFDQTVDAPPTGDAPDAAPQPKRLQYQAAVQAFHLPSKLFGGTVKFVSVDLYDRGANARPLDNTPAVQAVKKELPVDALGIGLDAPARHLPLYYIKNLVGPQVNGLDLNYGSLFALTHEGQTAGSGFGIWLGPTIARDALVSETTNIIVLANLATQVDGKTLQQLATSLLTTPSTLSRSSVTVARAVPAFDTKGLVVGGFLPDSGLPFVASLQDYIARSSQKPAKDAAKAPVMGDVKAAAPTTLAKNRHLWEFEQYAGGSKWKIRVGYRRTKEADGKDNVEVFGITVFQDNQWEVSAGDLTHTMETGTDVYKREAYWWDLKFERNNYVPYICAVEYNLYGTPLVGWDTNVRKEGRCK